MLRHRVAVHYNYSRHVVPVVLLPKGDVGADPNASVSGLRVERLIEHMRAVAQHG